MYNQVEARKSRRTVMKEFEKKIYGRYVPFIRGPRINSTPSVTGLNDESM
jgi:hypothetical protein